MVKFTKKCVLDFKWFITYEHMLKRHFMLISFYLHKLIFQPVYTDLRSQSQGQLVTVILHTLSMKPLMTNTKHYLKSEFASILSK